MQVRYVPIADINHHLFRVVVIALIRLFRSGDSKFRTSKDARECSGGGRTPNFKMG